MTRADLVNAFAVSVGVFSGSVDAPHSTAARVALGALGAACWLAGGLAFDVTLFLITKLFTRPGGQR